MGGAETVTLSAGGSHQLANKHHTLVLSSGGAGTADLKLPKARNLPLRTMFVIQFGTLLSVDFQVKNASGTVQSIYDLTRTVRTLIDASEPSQWTAQPAIEATLILNTTNDGVWTLRYFGET